MSTLAEIRDAYIRCHRPGSRKEAAHFAAGSLRERILKAANANSYDRPKHRHQWLIAPDLLAQFAARLVVMLPEIERARSFPELLSLVSSARIKGVGPLTVYDTAQRIGWGQRIEPKEVYLHAGTREGAKRLKWEYKRDSIRRSALPSELASLSASEIEDMLCIYADYFGSSTKKVDPKGCGGIQRGCGTRRAKARGCG